MKLAVGFVTYNDSSAKYLGDFLPSLRHSLNFLPVVDKRILTFDNSSQDNNINRLALEYFVREHPDEMISFSSKENIGFGSAYNVLITQAKKLKAEYFLMINPDVLLEPDAIEKLLSKMETNKDLASVSPKILRWDFNNHKQTKQLDSCGLSLKSGLRFNDLGQGEIDNDQYNETEIIGPSGAIGLFRLSALESIKDKYGYFDSRFFMYKEDCDLAYRLHLAGFKSALVPEALAYHDRTAAFYGKGISQSLLNRRQTSKQVRAWSFKNQHLLFVKHFKNENFKSKFVVIARVVVMFVFSLILEQFNLKQYPNIVRVLKS
ncbi:MAG: glycosyltransferase family 2 protein [Patescibacteria group bacterium]